MKYRITFPVVVRGGEGTNFIGLIKFYRFLKGAGLKEAKGTVESISCGDLSTRITHNDERSIDVLRKYARHDCKVGDIRIEIIHPHPIKGSFSVDGEGICTLSIEQGKNSLNMMVDFDKVQETLDFFNKYCVLDKEE